MVLGEKLDIDVIYIVVVACVLCCFVDYLSLTCKKFCCNNSQKFTFKKPYLMCGNSKKMSG